MEKGLAAENVCVMEEQILQEEKERFLRWQFFLLTIAASFRRGNVYEKGASEETKRRFRHTLFYALNGIAATPKAFQDEAYFISCIRTVQHQSMNYDHILKGRKLRFGTCQKLVNLYLKYLWTAGLIKTTPLHFPLDRLIQNGGSTINWTSLEDEEEYLSKLNEIHSEEDKAEWELKEYNKNFYDTL